MKLVIVESPTKCQTIQRYLGKDYFVVACKGHIRDLAKSGKGGLGVDIENGFKPTYIVSSNKRTVVADLKKLVNKADEVILATDPDREGEAIAWHLAEVLNLDINTTKRLEFHEITRDSIMNAIANPRTIDMNLVSSQETRRIIDRIIGFKLSTLLYNRIHSRSAGRVQSATLKIIADHDKEIKEFVEEEFYKLTIKAKYLDKEYELTLKRKDRINTIEEALKILDDIDYNIIVNDVEKEIKTIESKPPFTTSTLQQAAFNKFKYKTRLTQTIASQLYEGIDIENEHVGFITYIRTDSNKLSPTFIARAKDYISETYGDEYIGFKNKTKKNKMAQDAHEAIRHTSNHRTPEMVKPYLTKEQYNLYKLIYDRTLASLMAPKKEEITTITFNCKNDTVLTLEGKRVIFDGYEKLYKEESDDKKSLPLINVGDTFNITFKGQEQKFTQPPSPYSEAKIVSIMEEVGIGRPSTYASTITTLNQRKYVENKAGILTITEQGDKTSFVLNKYFPDIVDAKYTAQMEEKLDNVQAGEKSRKKILEEFYEPFIEEFNSAFKNMYKDKDVPTGEPCPKCGSQLVIKTGKNGTFIGCSNYPKCTYIKKEEKDVTYTGETCPKCGKPLVERINRKKQKFVACSGFPKCNYIKVDTPKFKVIKERKPLELVGRKCPKCGNDLVYRTSKKGQFIGCSAFPRCRYIETIEKK